MDTQTLIDLATKGAAMAMDAALLFTRAVTAANNGDMAAAQKYLADGRSHFDQAVADWQAAGAVTPPAEPTQPV
jgi:predicted glycosyltransferase